MCGIAGTIGRRAQHDLVRMLYAVEYRGYDSTGVCLVDADEFVRHRTLGGVAELEHKLVPSPATAGIGHTRWATHGAPSERNAHPHLSADGRIAIVHNGTLHNAEALRLELEHRGVTLSSDTDSEVIAHLVRAAIDTDITLQDAVRLAVAQIEGTYALLVVDRLAPDTIVATTNGGSLLIGTGASSVCVASDLAALAGRCDRYRAVRTGEICVITRDGVTEADRSEPEEPAWQPLDEYRVAEFGRGAFPDFMSKEIHEQQAAARRFLDSIEVPAEIGDAARFLDAHDFTRVKFLGCGSSYYAGQLGAHFVESLARIPADAEPATEFFCRDPLVDDSCLYVLISQSGETLDTLVAERFLRDRGVSTLGIVNVADSALARECTAKVLLQAGPEVSVASTKVFTNASLACLWTALHLAGRRDSTTDEVLQLRALLPVLPGVIGDLVDDGGRIRDVAAEFCGFDHMYFIGRAGMWPVAREGAQKIKEISYVHAEAYQASELKHGPLALVDSSLASVVLFPRDEHEPRNLTTVEQIQARGGPVLVFAQGDAPPVRGVRTVRIPSLYPYLDHIIMNIGLQLFAYHAARALGRDVDRPRNLAKSVTVE